MRKIKNIILLILFLLSSLVNANDLLVSAEKAYESKNYKKAIESYEQLLKEGYTSSHLYYNLGNAYYRNNQLGKAIYNYERAKKIDPNNADVKNNLAIAYSKTIDKIEVKENFFISAVKTNVLSTFSTSVWAWFTIGLSVLVFVFLYLFFAGPSTMVKRLSFFVTVVLLVVLFVVYFLGKSAVNAKTENNFAVITSPQIKIYTEPSSTSSSKFNLHEGTRVKIIDMNADWILIKLENGNEGWLKLADVGVF